MTRSGAPARFFPDFLTPVGHRGGLADGLEAIRSTPAGQLRSELTLLARLCPTPSWLRPLAEGDARAVTRPDAALRHYHRLALGPYSSCIERRVAEVRRRHSELMATGGTELLLKSLGPSIRWRSPVLEASFLRDRDVRLDGRGLLLVPSFFCVGKPVPFFDPELPPVLVYPITHDPAGRCPSRGATPARWPTSSATPGCGCSNGSRTRRARPPSPSATWSASPRRRSATTPNCSGTRA